MPKNLVQKILDSHVASGTPKAGEPVELVIDQTLTQDATGTMAYIQLEAMGVDQVKTELSVSYVDHNTLQSGYMNADDHAYLQSVAAKHGVSSKDIILELLRRLSVKGGVGRIFEYTGPGVKNLSVYQRATITNMGAELGATTSIFPSDETTRAFLARQQREEDYMPMEADPDADYDETVVINLSGLQPLAACPHSPDNVKPVSELAGMKVDQVSIGSCTNSGFEDLMKAANVLKGKTVVPNVSLTVSPGSRQVLTKLIENGALATFVQAGARILECTCGPCIGMGQSPKTDGVSLRTFNRNFYGRSGTLSAGVYLVSPETAAASAVAGVFTDPSTVDYSDAIPAEPSYVDDSMICQPSDDPESVEIIRGPNIKPLPENTPLAAHIEKKAVIKLPDNITTDHIAPAGAEVLPYRSNIEKLSTFVFRNNKEGFADVCQANDGGFIVAGENYGQGSSREHAAMAPMYLGIKAVMAKSFARIHKANLINFGIIPLTFGNPADYDDIDEMDVLAIEDTTQAATGKVSVKNVTKGTEYVMDCDITDDDFVLLQHGGALNFIKNSQPLN